MKTGNDYIDFYGENNISPVNQDISDFDLHLKRRQKLYRQCGIPTFAFRNATMLEVGPGGGHNALAPLTWGVRHIDLVEPNPAGADTLVRLFDSRGIDQNHYTVYRKPIEEFFTDKKYDIVVAEGFLMYVENWREICQKLKDFVAWGGVVVVAGADDNSEFIELIKRLIGQALTCHIDSLEEKVDALVPIFEPQLRKLKGVSRPAKDWIYDNVFNTAQTKDYKVSMGDFINVFSDFDLLGSSPGMFTDYSWYKDVWYDVNQENRRQFDEKRLSLVMAGLPEQAFPASVCSKASELLSEIKRIENEYELTNNKELLKGISDRLASGRDLVEMMDASFLYVYDEIVQAVQLLASDQIPNMSDYPHFFASFGRNIQYMGFMKK